PGRSRPWPHSAPGRGSRSQPSIQSASRSRKAATSARVTRARGEPISPGQAAKADEAMYGEPSSSGGPSGSTCHHVCPAAASQSTNRYASDPSRPPGREVTCSNTPLERGRFMPPGAYHAPWRGTEELDDDSAEDTVENPDPAGLADARLPPLAGQALGRRLARRLGGRVRRRARHDPGRRALQAAGLAAVVRDAYGGDRQRPLARRVRGHGARPLAVHGHGLDRPVGVVAVGAEAQARGGPE